MTMTLQEAFEKWTDAFNAHDIDGFAAMLADTIEEGTFTGTHDGVLHTPTGDVPPTGRRVTAGYIQVNRFRDGKVIYSNLMYDQLPMLEQLGLMPATAPAG